MRRLLVSLGLALMMILFTAAPAQAHAIGVACTLRGDRVDVEAFYDDDTPAQQARVEVVNAQGDIVASGLTDAKGQWFFATPLPGKYEVRVDAGAGHRTQGNMTVPGQSPTQETTISDKTTRAEFTRTPWLKIMIGLIVIGGGSGAFLLVTLLRRTRTVAAPAGIDGER